jgi:hypothetical protein
VPDLNALELGQNNYIYGRFGGHMDTINTSAQSGGLKMRLNAKKVVPTEVAAFCYNRWINGDQRFLKLKLKLKFKMMSDDSFFV